MEMKYLMIGGLFVLIIVGILFIMRNSNKGGNSFKKSESKEINTQRDGKFTKNDISLYIFNWKKTNENTLKLYNKAIKIIDDVTIVNSDENYKFNENIKTIQLDDSYYYGGQYDSSIKDVKNNKIFGVIVGDTINVDFNKLISKLLNTYNNYNVGIYSPHDLRSWWQNNVLYDITNELKVVDNTDVGIWFLNPKIVKQLKNLDYNISYFGWGIDVITIKQCKKENLLVIRDYSIKTDQIDKSTGYDSSKAKHYEKKLIEHYEKYIN